MLRSTRAVNRNGSCGHAPARMSVLMAILMVAPLKNAPAIAQTEHSPDTAVAGMVAQELAQLGVKPKTAVLPSDRALEATTAIKHGDYASGQRIAATSWQVASCRTGDFIPSTSLWRRSVAAATMRCFFRT